MVKNEFPPDLARFLSNKIIWIHANNEKGSGYLSYQLANMYPKFSKELETLQKIYPLLEQILNTNQESVFTVIYNKNEYFFKINTNSINSVLSLKKIEPCEI